MPAPRSSGTSTRSDEAGTGLISAIGGVTAFLVLLLFACQLAFNLYATSAVGAVAFDAASEVARSGTTAQAEAGARRILDGFAGSGGSLDLRWDVSDPEVVVLTVRAERPSLLAGLRAPFSTIVRTVVVRREVAR